MTDDERISPYAGLERDLCFGPFALRQHGEALYRDGKLVRLGSRARSILALLIRNAGQVVSKREIMEAVWPETTVVEANLTVHIAALRQALGDNRDQVQFIVNLPGRGYRFVAEVEAAAPATAIARSGAATQVETGNLPGRLVAPVGRADALVRIGLRMDESQILTITGPAGVGKTTAALAAAEHRTPQHPHGVWFVDLVPATDEPSVVKAIAFALRLELPGSGQLGALVDHLANKQTLIVLDNCEHLIEAAASVVSAILSGCATTSILATSREPLHVVGESLFRLPPLSYPPSDTVSSAEEALSYPAVQLFAQRAAAASADFAVDDGNAASLGGICRRLDGLPLAIEFAAALIEPFGAQGMLRKLDEHLKLLEIDRRGGTPRHRTLDAALDWSFQLLTEQERSVLLRTAIFSGGFTMDAAEGVICDAGENLDVSSVLAGLTLKSLIVSDVTGHDLRFRILETTRAFALARLSDSGARRQLADRHARYFAEYFQRRFRTMTEREADADAPDVENLRSALRHSLSPAGNLETAIGLVVHAPPVWNGLSLLDEYRNALEAVTARMTPEQRSSAEGWAVHVALRNPRMFTSGVPREDYENWPPPPRGAADYAALKSSIAHMLSQWVWNIRHANYVEAMELARQHAALVASEDDSYQRGMSTWVVGRSLFHVGALHDAREHLSRFLATEEIGHRRTFRGSTGYDRRPGVQAMLATTLSLLGDKDAAVEQAEEAERIARSVGKALPVCETLGWTSAALLIGGHPVEQIAERARELISIARLHSLGSHLGIAIGLLGVCRLMEEEFDTAAALLGEATATLEHCQYGPFDPWFVGARAYALARLGRQEDAERCLAAFRMRSPERRCWCAPEMLRYEALVLASDDSGSARVRDVLDRAAALARAQGANAWDLAIAGTRAALCPADEPIAPQLRHGDDAVSYDPPRIRLLA